jgi:peroxiredoxin
MLRTLSAFVVTVLTLAVAGPAHPVLAAEAVHPAVLGEEMPAFTLPSLQGGEVSLAGLRGKNLVLVFPRVQYGEGKWCTICNYGYAELAELEAAEGVRRAANAEILFVVPFGREIAQRWIDATPGELAKIRDWKNPEQKDDKSLAFAAKVRRHLPLDLDPAKGARGLPFPILLDADRSLTSGLDLFRTEWAGAKAEQLVPAVFVLDRTGIVRYKHVAQASTWDRPTGREIVDVLRAVAR